MPISFRFCRLMATAFFIAALSGSALAQGYTVTRNVAYAQVPGYDINLTSLDIYQLTDGKKHPVMVSVHGGGWYRGDKAEVDAKPNFYLSNGWLFISVNYRLTDTTAAHPVAWPTHAQDLARAIVWVYRSIGAYDGDTSKIYLMGHSAGCHLVSILAANQEFLNGVGLPLRVIKGVISLDTQAYDLFVLAGSDGKLGDTLAIHGPRMSGCVLGLSLSSFVAGSLFAANAAPFYYPEARLRARICRLTERALHSPEARAA